MRSGLKHTDIKVIGSKKKGKQLYYDTICTFDIEVTNYKVAGMENGVGITYLWVFASEHFGDWYGRTIEEYVEFINYLSDAYKEAVITVYCHNLAYEWQFIRKSFEWEHTFLLNRRKPLTASSKNIEYRCSYILTNKSLEVYLKDSDIGIEKLSYDYDKVRLPWHELTESELEYCHVDARGLCVALRATLEKNNDDITTVPLTSTGYVRRDLRKRESEQEKRLIKNLSIMSTELYIALKSSFVGGNTHANRFYSGEIVENVHCYDIASSYPNVQLTMDFPVSQFVKSSIATTSDMKESKAYLINITMLDIELIDQLDPMPTISVSKCLEITGHTRDNGRVLSAQSLTIWVTDLELKIITNHYRWSGYTINKAFQANYGQLPDGVKACIYKYYYGKCTLKGVDEYHYMKSKELLNAIYGMSAFDVGKLRYIYEEGDYVIEEENLEILINKANEAKTPPPEPYCWGVWTTAWARTHLDEVIRMAGDRFLYCDTDSVWTFGELEFIDKINEKKTTLSKNYEVEYNGKKYNIGIWEHDKHASKFVSLGAKKYCYVSKGEVHTVTAGVSKKSGVKRIEDYKDGHVFKNATLKATYNDEDTILKIDGKEIKVGTNVYLEPSDYTLGLSNDYAALLLYLRGDSYEQVFYK